MIKWGANTWGHPRPPYPPPNTLSLFVTTSLAAFFTGLENKKSTKEYTFWRQCHEKQSIILGCPGDTGIPLWGELGRQHVVESVLGQKGSLGSWSRPAYVCSGVCSCLA